MGCAITGSWNVSYQPKTLAHGSGLVNDLQSISSARSFHSSPAAMDDLPQHLVVGLPALSPTMESGTIASWNLQEGESFSAGDVICGVETDKATVDFEAQDDGVVAKLLMEPGNEIPVGTPIMITVEEEDDVGAFKDYVHQASEAPAAAEAAPSPAVSEESTSSSPPAGAGPADSTLGDFVLMPSARHLAQSKGLDATVLAPGSGKGGRVTKGDVLKAIAANSLPALAKPAVAAPSASAPTSTAAAPAVPKPLSLQDLVLPEIETNGATEDVANSKMRKIIASRLTESKREVPHFYTSFNVELDQVMKLRKALAAEHEVKVSVNDFVIRCSALALRDVPEVNGTLGAGNSVKYSDSIDISVAVATPTGLITPIVFDTDQKGLSEISSSVKDLATRARDGKLAPHEYQGGTFSISNLGMFGISEFSAVINPPQAAILAVGGGTKTFIPSPYVDGAEKQAPPSVATLLTARLSADRRVVDEPTAALFGQAFTYYMNNPNLLLL